MKTVKKIAGLLLGIFITLSFMTRIAYADTDPGEYQYKVLYISSYSENFITNPDELEGIRSVFDPVGIDLDTE
ncbi:MAG TPA: hypothetical protein PLU43_02115, partial [Lachnospiraceae bacterium]|nr:hypothetical protein [Lachnospiraceae bacterium]